MVDIDMTREPETGLLLGVNLWEVRDAKVERAQSSNEQMLVLKLKCGDHELIDRAMLGGKGWRFGRQKLIALGLATNFSGALDPVAFIGVRVWVATKEEPYEYIDRKTGEKKKAVSAKVDVDQLAHAGFQPAAMVPVGATLPTAIDDTPF